MQSPFPASVGVLVLSNGRSMLKNALFVPYQFTAQI